ncbi:7673_t:CDS:1, partial [Paraglomus occultum]
MSASKENNAAYTDPMLIKNSSYKCGKKSDIFSLGVIFWEIFSGKSPCEGHTQSAEIFKYRLKGFRDKPVPGIPDEYTKLYTDCWNEDPDKRPFCKEIHDRLKLFEQLAMQGDQSSVEQGNNP